MNTDPPAGEAGLTFITNEPPAFAEASAVAKALADKSAGKEANLLDRFGVLTYT